MNALARRPARLILLVVLAAAAVGAAWAWHRAGSSTEVSPGAALAGFRERGGAAGARPPGAPRPGVYTYVQTGAERGALGPVGVRRDLPDEARYVVTASPDGYLEELSLSREHVEATRFVLGGEGARATWRRSHVTFAGLGRDDRRELVPPPLHMPRVLAPGRTWGGRYRAGTLAFRYRSRALRREGVEVGGRLLPAVVVEVTTRTSGAHPGTRRETLWWSPALSMPLRWRIALDVGGPATLHTDADLVLRAVTPLTGPAADDAGGGRPRAGAVLPSLPLAG